MQCEPGHPAGLRLTKCNVSPVRMPAHSFNQTRTSSVMLCLLSIVRSFEGGNKEVSKESRGRKGKKQ